MSLNTGFPLPQWAEGNRQRFAIRMAALYHNEKGSIADLSCALGYSSATIAMQLKGPGLSKQTCLALEALLGADLFPRQWFRPDLFPAEAAE